MLESYNLLVLCKIHFSSSSSYSPYSKPHWHKQHSSHQCRFQTNQFSEPKVQASFHNQITIFVINPCTSCCCVDNRWEIERSTNHSISVKTVVTPSKLSVLPPREVYTTSVPSAVAIRIGQSLPSIVRGPAIPNGCIRQRFRSMRLVS